MVDIIVLLILVISVIFGYRKGFLRTLTGLIAIMLSFVLALSFSPKLESYIKTTVVYENIYENIEKSMISSDADTDEYNTAKLNMPRQMLKDIEKGIEEKKNEAVGTLIQKVCDTAVKIISMVIIFVAVRLIIMLLLLCFGILRKLPLIGWFDRILGALFGFLRGMLIVYLLLAVVTVSTAFNNKNTIIDKVNHSEFAKVMYNNNVFLDFVAKD